jgi:uncharacterized protein
MSDQPPNPLPARRWAELIGLYIVPPALVVAYDFAAAPMGWPAAPKIPLLLAFVIVVCALLLRDGHFDRTALWRVWALRSVWRLVLVRFTAGAAGLTLFTWLVYPEALFGLVRDRPAAWAVLMVGYPLLSVYPQELAWRTYFFHRFGALFPNRYVAIAINAAVFGYMHIVYMNGLAVLLTAVGGVFFADTYRRTGSAFAASVDHALFGCWIFTVGLGTFLS